MAFDRRALFFVTLVFSLCAGFVAVSRESLWIDEANSALKAMQPSLQGWWQVMVAEKGSDLQMPLYMLQIWVWEKVFGHTEFALRAANIVWFCVGQLAVFWALRRHLRMAWITITLGLISPLLWFYLNDARPYVMQYAGACLLCAALVRATEDVAAALRPGALWLFGAGLLVLSGSSLLGVIWAGGAIVAWLVLIWPKVRAGSPRQMLAPVAVIFLSLAALGTYYLWTVLLGTGASQVGRTSALEPCLHCLRIFRNRRVGPGTFADKTGWI